MSLLAEAMEKCVMMDRITISDGMGGFETTWTEGAEFDCAIVFDTSMESRTADKLGVTSLYTFTINKSVLLNYHDVIKRKRDGKIFRITSDGDDKFTPASATLNMRQVTAEEWRLNNE